MMGTEQRPVAARAAVVSIALLAAVLVALGFGWGSEPEDGSRRPEPTGRLEIDGPRSVSAGEPVALAVNGAALDLGEAQVVVASSAGTVAFTASLDAGEASIELEPGLTAVAGRLTIWVIAGGDEAGFDLAVLAREAVSPIVPLVGPKSIVADGDDHAMVIALPTDGFGNAASNARSTLLSVRHPDGTTKGSAMATTGLIHWTRVFSGTKAGRSEVATILDGAYGPTADVVEVAGPAVPFGLYRAASPLQADGRSLHVVYTDRVVDRFGNVMPDGTAVTMTAEDPTGRRQATTMTIDGRAELTFEAPDAPGTMRVVAQIGGVSSSELELEFEPAVAEWPMEVTETASTSILHIGPVRTVDAGFVPDGTPVTVRQGAVVIDARLVDGRTQVEVASRYEILTVEILGIEQGLGR